MYVAISAYRHKLKFQCELPIGFFFFSVFNWECVWHFSKSADDKICLPPFHYLISNMLIFSDSYIVLKYLRYSSGRKLCACFLNVPLQVKTLVQQDPEFPM